jgi:transcriptional regulator with XRE-family HTH domain
MAKTAIRIKFGKRIQQIRKDKGFTQESLADSIGIHRTYIGIIERGEQSISLDNVYRISKALKISLCDLFENL